MTKLFSTIAKGLAKSSEELTFSKRSPQDYSMMLLEQAGISDLTDLNHTFIGDPGFDVRVRERTFGMGLEFEGQETHSEKSGWLLFERMPGEGGEFLRARVFNSFAGAAAEFAVKLRLHPQGDVKVVETPSRPGAWQLSFSGAGRQMVMSPFEVGLEAASATR